MTRLHIRLCDRSGITLTLVVFRSILNGFLADGFLMGVAALGDGLVSATVEVFRKVSREMLPTPSRPHYTFNLRDISKVVQVSRTGVQELHCAR